MSVINSFMKFFLPKDRIFYQLFEEVAITSLEMSVLLKKMVNEREFETRAEILRQIEDLEHKNDDLTHKIFTELSRNFITPFDREDIHYLASAMDDVADIFSLQQKRSTSIVWILSMKVSPKWLILLCKAVKTSKRQ